MKHTYETFSEICRDFIDGDTITHIHSEHQDGECFVWQKAIIEFAKFLDNVGVKIIANPEIYDELWERAKEYIYKEGEVT